MATKLVTVAIFLSVLLAPSHRAEAIVVYQRNGDEPVIGQLVRQDANTVVIQQHMTDGRSRLREIPRSNIEEMLPSVSARRLESLSPDRPHEYLEYAEELAEKKRDPESRRASLRLYVVAAYLQPEELGHGSMLGMITLARSAAEERRFRAMAFLLDADHNRDILRPPADKSPKTAESTEMRARVLALIQSVRRGRSLPVNTLLRDEPLKRAFDKVAGGLAYTDVLALGRDIPPATLHKLLTMELRLTANSQDTATQDDADSWSGDALNEHSQSVPTLTLETLTEFDPRQCIFEAGQWRAPRQ